MLPHCQVSSIVQRPNSGVTSLHIRSFVFEEPRIVSSLSRVFEFALLKGPRGGTGACP